MAGAHAADSAPALAPETQLVSRPEASVGREVVELLLFVVRAGKAE
jgi:hypothetical protein